MKNVFFAACLALAGCTTFSGFERDVVRTPRYSENNVFFVPSPTADAPKVGLVQTFLPVKKADGDVITHGQPLSIVVNSVSMPPEAENPRMTRDVAVVLDIGTAADGSATSIAVWYQRGVLPNQTLNFSNLLVYNEPSWDSRVAPYFRMRLVDVRQERSQEVKKTLEEVTKFSSGLVSLVGNPLLVQSASLGIRAAGMVLGNQSNEVLLDYSVQLYSGDLAERGGAGLGALKRGSFLVVGRPDLCGTSPCGRTFWTRKLQYDWGTRELLDENGHGVVAPYISLRTMTSESVVPKLVLERSAALFKHFSQLSTGASIEQVGNELEALKVSVKAYLANEKVRRYRQTEDLGDLVTLALDTEVESGDLGYLLRTLSDVAGKPLTSRDEVKEWWTATASKCKLNATTFKLECAKA